MEGTSSSSSRSNKRRLYEDDDISKPPVEKKPRFPKGKKKVKEVEQEEVAVCGPVEAPPVEIFDTKVAAHERAKRRIQMIDDLISGEEPNAIDKAEVRTYKENANFEEDGTVIEPFNLEQEKEEGYFDDNGNFVHYATDKGIKDAWLDSVDAESNFARKSFAEESFNKVKDDEESDELSSDDVGKIKRRIADLLEPEETVLQALKRLKGTSNGKKEKMPEQVKLIFDQLTEDSMKLMDNGDYDVYNEKKEAFEREAEGYERLARAREGIFLGAGSASIQDSSRNVDDDFDMFAEDDKGPVSNASSDGNGFISGSAGEGLPSESSDLQSDYIFDESSGYYYSSSLGYYYDPTSGLYCSASSGKWYLFNEQAGTYDEVQGDAETATSIK
ncbi:hypothetical protein MKX01_001543 [Papaver californicum]|nr:hypothetical protein MKX01_036002 [Papaver californicum]KAI3974713.1 hypothetical protein MKX01_001543 [Papaver californicum]